MEKIKLPRPESLEACPELHGDYIQKICEHLAEMYDVIEKNSDAYGKEDQDTLKKAADKLHYYLDGVHLPNTAIFSIEDIVGNEYVLGDLTGEDADFLVTRLQDNRSDLKNIFKHAAGYSENALNQYSDEMEGGLREAIENYAESARDMGLLSTSVSKEDSSFQFDCN